MYELRILGSPRLVGPDGNDLRSVLSQPKRLALLSYLAVTSTGGYVRRDKLVGLFWAESSEQRARASLSGALSKLRQSIGPSVVTTRGHEEVGIAEGQLRCDAVEFLKAVEAEDWSAVANAYHGALLDGFFLDGCPGFDSWLEQTRAHFKRTVVNALGRLTEEAMAAGDDSARWLAERAYEISPLDGGAVRRLIGVLALAGQRDSALGVYESHARRLFDERGVEPSPATRLLVEEILAGAPGEEPDAGGRINGQDASPVGGGRDAEPMTREAVARPSGALASVALSGTPGPVTAVETGPRGLRSWVPLVVAWYHGEKGRQSVSGAELLILALLLALAGWGVSRVGSGRGTETRRALGEAGELPRIAVLPFQDFSIGAEPGATDGGFQEELTKKLDHIPGIDPISRNSVDAWARRENRSTIPELAAEADLDYVVEGSVQKWGDSIRFTIHLIEAPTDRHLWSRDYAARYSVAEYVRLQSEIVQQIAYDLRAHVSPEDLAWLEAVPTRSLEAFEAYRAGVETYQREVYTNWSDERYRSTELLNRALELDPDFGAARAYLALSLSRGDREAREVGRVEAERALVQTEDLWEAHRALADIYGTRGDQDRRAEHLERALELAPPLEQAVLRRQLALVDADLDEQLRIWEEERSRDPLRRDVYGNLARLYLGQHRYEEALEANERFTVLLTEPDEIAARRAVRREMIIHVLRGDVERARELHRYHLEPGPSLYDFIPVTGHGMLLLRILTPDQRRKDWEVFLNWSLPPDLRLEQVEPPRQDCFSPDPVELCLRRAIHERDVGSPETARILWDSLTVAAETVWEEPVGARGYLVRALVYMEVGSREQALTWARTAVERFAPDGCASPDRNVPACWMLARVLARFGREDEALDLIEEMLPPPSNLTVHMLRLHPWWEDLWGHPRFEQILLDYADQVEVPPA